MRKEIVLVGFIFFLFLAPSIKGGLMIQEQAITLKPGDMIQRCGMACVWEPQGEASYSVEITGLDKFVDKVEPSEFVLEEGVPCPQEAEARRACIAAECNNPESKSAVALCIYFSAPREYSFNLCNGLPCAPEEKEYIGAIRAFRKVGAAVGVEPMRFAVFYTPKNGWPIVFAVAGMVVIAGSIALAYRPLKRRFFPKYVEVKFCKKCNKKYKKDMTYCSSCGKRLETKTEKR
jgi:hypothetical protein